MSIYRAAIGFSFDSSFPRDVEQITPHFQGTDPTALANQLKTNLIANGLVGSNTPFKVKIYDAQKAKPNYPLVTVEQGGTPRASAHARELALCLSFYGSFNRPRYRGRVYIPGSLISGTIGLRPSGTQINDAFTFHTVFINNMGGIANWVVYSRRNNEAYLVTHCWVDDEWDIVRRRGLRPTTRQETDVSQVP